MAFSGRGPIPKRNAERLTKDTKRRNQEAPSATANPVPAPRANPEWHPIARAWYNSLAASGMAQFYEPSDWAMAIVGAETVSRELEEKYLGANPGDGPIYGHAPMNPQSLNALLKLSGVLGMTEGDRRRLGVELTRTNHEAEQEAQILHLVKTEEDEAFG